MGTAPVATQLSIHSYNIINFTDSTATAQLSVFIPPLGTSPFLTLCPAQPSSLIIRPLNLNTVSTIMLGIETSNMKGQGVK